MEQRCLYCVIIYENHHEKPNKPLQYVGNSSNWHTHRLYMYKRPSPSLLLLLFIEFLCQEKFPPYSESFFHTHIGFLDAHGDHYTATVYIHYMLFLSLQLNSRKNLLSIT
jgi:hypothetical protein